MGFPTFSKAGVPTVALSQGSTFPSGAPLTPNQFVGVSDANTVRVYSLGPPKRQLEAIFEQLTHTDITALEAFFNNPLVNWGTFSFVYTDEDATAWTVRYLAPVFDPRQVTDDNYALTLTFTVE